MISFEVVPADTYVFLKLDIDPTIKSKILSMQVLYNDDNSVKTAFWKKHEVSSAEILFSSVKVPIALADGDRKWTFIVVLTHYDDITKKYITLYSDRSLLVGLIQPPPRIVLSNIENDKSRSITSEDSYYVDATLEADSLDSIDGLSLLLYDDSGDLGNFRKIIFYKQQGTDDFFIEGDNTTPYAAVKINEGMYKVTLLIGHLDMAYTYEIAAMSSFQMLFSDISNTILFSPDIVPYLIKLVDKKMDIILAFDFEEGSVKVDFNMFSPGNPAEDGISEKLVIYVEKYQDAERTQLIGSGEISLLSQDKTFQFYDDNNRDTGNVISFETGSLISKADATQKLVEIGEINYLRVYVENSHGRSKRSYDIDFQPIKLEAAPVLEIREILADTKEIGIKWTPSTTSYKNDISVWKVTRSEVFSSGTKTLIETIDVLPSLTEGVLIHTFSSLTVDTKYYFDVFAVIKNDYNFTTWSKDETINGKSSNEAFGVTYDTYLAPTVTADTFEVNSDRQCILYVTVPTLPNFIQIDDIKTDYTGDDGSSGTQSTAYSQNVVVVITGLSDSVKYVFKVYVIASLKSGALSNPVPTHTTGTKSESVTFRPWKRVAVELEFNGTQNSGSFGLKFLRQIITSDNGNAMEYISNTGKLKLAWRQPYSTNEIKTGVNEFYSQEIPLLSDPNILPGFLTFVVGTLSFMNPNDSTQTISTDSYETVCVKSDPYTPSNLSFKAEPTIGDQGSTKITWENPVFDASNLFNSADQLDKTNLVGFELKRYSEEDSDFISLPFSTGYRLLTNVSDIVSNRSTITPIIGNEGILGGSAGPTTMTPAIARLKYDGFYYKKSVSATSGSTSKINWYLSPESNVKVSDLKQMFFKLKLINKASVPFIVVYTKPTGTGDAASWYKSRRTLEILDTMNLVNSANYLAYFNFNGNTSIPVSDGHTSVALSPTNVSGSDRGTFAPTEEIQFIAFSTNSAAAANTVEFIARSFSLQSTGKTETYSFSNIISSVFDKDIETPGKVYEFMYNYQPAELGKTIPFMVEAIYNTTKKTRAPVIGSTLAYKLPDAPIIVGVDSIDLHTLDIKITPPTQLGGGSIYGYLVELWIASIPQSIPLVNNNFSLPSMGYGSYMLMNNTTKQIPGWNVGDFTYIVNNDWNWGFPTPPFGNQCCAIQSISYIEQTINLAVGDYTLTFMCCGRPLYPWGRGANPLNLLLNGVAFQTNVTPSFTWTSYSFTFNVSTPGNNVIRFKGTINDGDFTSAIQNVVLTTSTNNIMTHSDITVLWQDLTDKTILRISDLTPNVQYTPSIKTLINLKTPLGEHIQSLSSLLGPGRYCLPSMAEMEVKNFRISQNGFNFADSITAGQPGASAELKWDSIGGPYAVTYIIKQVDASGVTLPNTSDVIVEPGTGTTMVLSGLKFVSGLSYFSIFSRVDNLNTVSLDDVISGPVSSASGHLYDTVTEAVKNLSVYARDTRVEVSWDLINQSTRNTNVANYRVCFWPATGSINKNDARFYAEVDSTTHFKTISNLQNGIQYKFAVLYSLTEAPTTFFDPDNGYLISSAIPYGVPSTPIISVDTTVGIKKAVITVTTESISNGSAILKYNIYRKISSASSFSLLGSVAKVNGVLTTYVDTNVDVGATYDYKVTAVCKNTNNNVDDVPSEMSNIVRKIIFVKFAIPSQLLTFEAISESDFTINFKSLKDELSMSSNSSTGFVQNMVSSVSVLDAKLQIACTYLNGQQLVTVTKEYQNSTPDNDSHQIKFSDLRGLAGFSSNTVCALTVSLLGKNPNDNQYVATDSASVQFQPFGTPSFSSFHIFNGTGNVAVKVIADPATTNYNFGVFSVFKCKVFVGLNDGYRGIESANLTSASGLFSYVIQDGDLGSYNPNRVFKFVITMETTGHFPATNIQTSNEVIAIVSAESSSSPDPVLVLKESFYYSQDKRKAYVKVDTSYASLASLIVIFHLHNINSSNMELYVDSRYSVTYEGVTYQVTDISSNAENSDDKLMGISTFEIPLVGFLSTEVDDFILLVATTRGVSRPYFVSTKSNNTLAYGKSEIDYFPSGTELSSSIMKPL